MKIGVQLYSIHDITDEKGIMTALCAAQVLGFDGVEFAGFRGFSAEEMLSELEKNSLKAYGAHLGCQDFEEKYDETVAYLNTIGAKTVHIPWADFDDAAGWANFGKRLDKIGKRLKADGILFGYHNHRQEFKKQFDGKWALDILLENTEPQNVCLELDTGHAAIAGVNPVEVARKYADRIKVIHVKDTDMTRDVAAGSGVVDFESLIKAAKETEYLIIENENIGKNLEELRQGCRYLKENFM